MSAMSDALRFDYDYLKRFEAIKKDPYRYILSKKEQKQCWNRPKRFLYILSIPSLYVYKHLRYHHELSRAKGLKFTSIQLLHIVPKLGCLVVLMWLTSYPFFVDYSRMKNHTIAKLELQKFDPEWFTYDDFNYMLSNAPVYKDEDSKWGRLDLLRLFSSYYQLPGWIKRRRENNLELMSEVPPKYDWTPKSPRKNNFNEILNQCVWHFDKTAYS